MAANGVLLPVIASVYLLGLGVLGGIAAERIRFSQERGALVARLEAQVRARQATLIALERGAGCESPVGQTALAGTGARGMGDSQ